MEDSATKKSRLVREQSSNGEVHLIFQDSRFEKSRKDAIVLDEAEIRIIMKKEASKPLLILREE
jgi:hypothetical protein